MAQPGRAPGSGPGGRRFKSSLPDQSFPKLARTRLSDLTRLNGWAPPALRPLRRDGVGVSAHSSRSSLSLDTMITKTSLPPRLYFSYSQFMVYDMAVNLPGCAWTNEHSAQGFARRESTVNFDMPLEFGHADVTIQDDFYGKRDGYDRVIAVPFLVTSGRVAVSGPEETNVERSFAIPPGNYRLIAAQRVTSDDEEIVDLFFETHVQALQRSSVLVADDALSPPSSLVETAEIAGEEF